MASVAFPFREITNVNLESNRISAKKNPISRSVGKSTHIRFEEVQPEETLQIRQVQDGKEEVALSSPFSFSAPPLVKQLEDSFSSSQYEFEEEFEDENDENADPDLTGSEGGTETEEEESDLWAYREPTKQPEWCGTRIFFSSSSSDEEGEETEEEEVDDEQMLVIQTTFARVVTAE